MSTPAHLKPLTPGTSLGVLGGGQLGRMWVQAAQSMGFELVVLDPDAQSPAATVAQGRVVGHYDDAHALADLARRCAAVTTEFENVPATSLETLAQHVFVAPGAQAVRVCQDRRKEKAHFVRSGVACAPYAVIESLQDAAQADEALFPGLLKTAQMGYDGKGQCTVRDREELSRAWQSLGQVPCVLEQRLDLFFEISVIVARGVDGQWVHLPVQQNLHREGILAITEVPAPSLSEAQAQQAVQMAADIAASLSYVGVLCVEFFVLRDGRLVANEMAPRPHNSGHYSLDACDVSQFELQLRTLVRWPLVLPRLHSHVQMINLLGDVWFQGDAEHPAEPDWSDILTLPGVRLHLYGKTQARRGRKMGHINVLGDSAEQVRATSQKVLAALGLPALPVNPAPVDAVHTAGAGASLRSAG